MIGWASTDTGALAAPGLRPLPPIGDDPVLVAPADRGKSASRPAMRPGPMFASEPETVLTVSDHLKGGGGLKHVWCWFYRPEGK